MCVCVCVCVWIALASAGAHFYFNCVSTSQTINLRCKGLWNNMESYCILIEIGNTWLQIEV